MLSRSLAIAITHYQRHISPHKGFCCAHRVKHGGDSCSEYVKQAVLAMGLWRSLPQIRSRFAECKAAALELRWEREDKRRKRRQQTQDGSSDCGLDYCDCADAVSGLLPVDCGLLDAVGSSCDACSCSL